MNYTKEGNDEYYTFCSSISCSNFPRSQNPCRQSNRYNLKKLLESKIMHASGSYMNLCHLHVTYEFTSKHPGEGRGGERLERKRYTSTGAGLFCRNNFRTHCTDTWYLVNTWSELFKRSIKLSSEYWAQLFKSCMDSTIHWKTLYPVDKY